MLYNFIEIDQKLFEILEIKNHTQGHTDRHIRADENNTCPNSKILDKVMKLKTADLIPNFVVKDIKV